MAETSRPPLIAVDIGNSRVKLGAFAPLVEPTPGELPEPQATLSLDPEDAAWDSLGPWLESHGSESPIVVCSVHRPTSRRLAEWLGQHRRDADCRLLSHVDLPLVVDLAVPEKVGVDRLVGAVAANQLRPADRPAVVIDGGSAITVDWITREGVFAGGAILPGITMSARAMHEQTDALPFLEKADLETIPPALGTSTTAAIESGLFWGAVGAMRELVRQLSSQQGDDPVIYLTGGAAPAVVRRLGQTAQYVPHMILGGVASAASKQGFWR